MEITYDDLRALGPRGNKKYIEELANAAPAVLPIYGIDTPLRLAHFWAQAAHECDGFATMGEYWGPTPAQRGYEGRKDLGNTQPGDGSRYRGRGIFQLTGRANYAIMSKTINKDLVGSPEKASNSSVALQIACEYWKSHNLNAKADKNDIDGITRAINGGRNGIADRRARFAIAWKIWGNKPDIPAPAKTMVSSHEGNAAILAGVSSLGSAVTLLKDSQDTVAQITTQVQGAKDAALSVGQFFGLSDAKAIAFGLLSIAVGACAYAWLRRRQRKYEDGV